MALLPPFMLDTVVAIGIGDDAQSRRWIGTGFLYGHAVGSNPQTWLPYIVTNKHVFAGCDKVWIKFNSANALDSTDYPLELVRADRTQLWTGHPLQHIDVAVIGISGGYLQTQARRFSFFRSDEHLMKKADLVSGQITEGDRVFVLGFPMGLVNTVRQYAICRHGILARIRDHLDGGTSSFLIDASIFPGNSGGPVIICPSALAINGTRTVPHAALIGVVKEYLYYEDIAVSRQTGMQRISFQENSGLARIESIDAVGEAIEEEQRAKIQASLAASAVSAPAPISPPSA